MKDKKTMPNNKRSWPLTVYIVLRLLVIGIMVIQFFNQNYTDVFLCLLTLILFQIPTFIDRKFRIEFPDTLQIVVLLFIFSAEILGELREFYLQYPIWDTLLHTTNGFLMAAIGFSFIDVFNRSEKISTKLTPISLTLIAFCFSMTIGVLWEFFEFAMDYFFKMDMQKDWMIHEITSVTFHPEGRNTPVTLPIESVVVNGKAWEGYLDIGLFDTMKDLIVNFIGAIVFCLFGFAYIKNRGKDSLAKKFIPIVRSQKKNAQN